MSKHEADLDRQTTSEIISAYGREEELLHIAETDGDYDYVLHHWTNRENWKEAITVLAEQTDLETFYKYSTVPMFHAATDLIDILTRQTNVNIKKIIPAFLNYNRAIGQHIALDQNQSIRYLLVCINHSHSIEPMAHNTLISLYASHPTRNKGHLLHYSKTQSQHEQQPNDADFALYLCIAHQRVQSAVHIYTTMKQYTSAVDLALKYNETELAIEVSKTPNIDETLRKKLRLKKSPRRYYNRTRTSNQL